MAKKVKKAVEKTDELLKAEAAMGRLYHLHQMHIQSLRQITPELNKAILKVDKLQEKKE